MRKVEPLARALAGKRGVDDRPAPRRGRDAAANAPIVRYDVGRGLVKVNPLATWTDADVAGYIQDRDLPEHPLARPRLRVDRLLAVHPPRRATARTPAPAAGPGIDKTECGLHG